MVVQIDCEDTQYNLTLNIYHSNRGKQMKKITVLILILWMHVVIAEEVSPKIISWQAADAAGQIHRFPEEAINNKQVTVLMFWATWCPYCQQLMPHLQSALIQYQEALNLKVYAMNINEDSDPEAYLNNNGFGFLLFPESEAVAKQYQVQYTPVVLVFDQQGQMVFDSRQLSLQDRVKAEASHQAKSIRIAPYLAAEVRQVLVKLMK